MDHNLRDHILFWSFATSGILFLLCILASLFYASLTKKFYCRLCAIGFLMIMAAIMILSPGPDQSPRQLVSVQSLNPGYYTVDEVWQVNKKFCAVIQPVRWDGEDKTNRILLTSPTSNHWLLCDVTGTDIVGTTSLSKRHPFTGIAIVVQTNQLRQIRMYRPFK